LDDEFCWLRPTPKYIPRKFGFLLLSELEDEEALTLKWRTPLAFLWTKSAKYS
jgi:hypothetical protein